MTSIVYSNGATTLGDLQYSYDAAGRRVRQGGSFSRVNLPASITGAIAYDANNRLTTWDGNSLTYDPNGNLQGVAGDTYAWDARNRLAGITGLNTASFNYDAAGRRAGKTIAGATTNFLYDGWQPIQELTSANSVQATLLTGGIDELFSRTAAGATQSFMTDALGSTLRLTDGAGTKVTDYTYEAYGQATNDNAASTNGFQYTGRENDNTNLYYYRNRYYHPGLGRFITEDPIGLAGGPNVYAYVSGNPVSYYDPYGLFDVTDLPGIPQPVVDAVAGFGDGASLGITNAIRDALDTNGAVDKSSGSYTGGAIGGAVCTGTAGALRGAAAFGGTRLGNSLLNSNRYLRIGPGRMPTNGPFPASPSAPRISIGEGPGNPHIDLRVRGID